MTEKEITATIKAVQKHGAAAVGKKMVDTIKEIKRGHIVKTHDRNQLAGMQTPQAAKYSLFKKAFQKAAKERKFFTDDAAFIENLGHKVKLIPASENNFKITPDDITNNVTDRTKVIIINSPSNPTGSMYSKDDLEKLAEALNRYDIHIISDDIYEFLIYDKKFCNIANIGEEIKKKTIVFNGVSKTYSMTGWRIGYMAGDEDLIKKIEILQSQSVSNPTSISQWASLEALTGDQSVVQDIVKVFHKRRDLIVEKLNDINGIKCMLPDGAFYAFPNISEISAFKGWKSIEKKYESESKSSILTSYLLEEEKVAVVPGIAFGSDNNIRLSFATSDENIINGVGRIKKAVEKLV